MEYIFKDKSRYDIYIYISLNPAIIVKKPLTTIIFLLPMYGVYVRKSWDVRVHMIFIIQEFAYNVWGIHVTRKWKFTWKSQKNKAPKGFSGNPNKLSISSLLNHLLQNFIQFEAVLRGLCCPPWFPHSQLGGYHLTTNTSFLCASVYCDKCTKDYHMLSFY